MARVLLIHHDTPTCRRLAAYLQTGHEFMAVENLLTGIKHLPKIKPEVIVVGQDSTSQNAHKLLAYMRDNRLQAAVVVVLAPESKSTRPMLLKLGAKSFVPPSVNEDQLLGAIRTALTLHAAQRASAPPITEEELNNNLSMLETRLNKQMKCFAGTNQVFIQTHMGHRASKPRIMLRCSLRSEYGLSRDVFYEWIRDVCCGDPSHCEAYCQFKVERETA
ncbi:MAG TPA: hypothetical protein VLM89_13395 [Phycisphaerae bacterium]|nr:hypothetical protein [Phycisphaerae bacterium]